MNTKLFEAFSGLDTELLERAERPAVRKKRAWLGLAAAAACVALAVALALPRMARDGELRLEGPSVFEPSPGMEDPGIGEKPGSHENPGDVQVPQPQPEGPQEPEGPGADTPMEYPTTPPELLYNEMDTAEAAPPAWLKDVTGRTSMSAWQLELVWSADCPTAFLEEGDGERFYYGNSVSGAAEYFSDGALYRLVLTFREEGNPVPVTVTVSPADGPLFTGCLPIEDGEADLAGFMGVVACRYDYGERILLAAETVIGEARYRFTAETPPEGEEEARQAVYDAVTRFQFNIFYKLCPRLDTFVMGDPMSGEPLVGPTIRTLLSLRLTGGAETAEYAVNRDGRVFLFRGQEYVEERLLSHEAQMELRGLVEDLDAESASNACGHEVSELTLTLYDPWNRETGVVSGCLEDCEVLEKVVEILTREGVLDA